MINAMPKVIITGATAFLFDDRNLTAMANGSARNRRRMIDVN